MPIRWSALKVKEAANMIEEYYNKAAEPLEQIREVAKAAGQIPNLPQYIDQYFVRIAGEVERAVGGSHFEPVGRYRAALENLRKALPEGSVKSEQEKLRHGITPSLM